MTAKPSIGLRSFRGEPTMTDLTAHTDSCRYQFAADPYRPLYHFVAPANFMGDPNGTIFWKGKYHLFYQYNPDGAYDQSSRMHWGHAVSENLVHWRDLPIALTPTLSGPDRSGCWSGGAFDNDGVPTLIYYGHPEGNCIATSDDDLIRWQKHPANPVIPHPPEGQAEWRPFDPCMWKEGNTYYSLAGGKLENIGDTAFLFQSRDMLNWQYMHPLYASGLEKPPESDCAVPDFFPLGDKHMLLFASHERGAQYYIGTYADHKFHPERHGRLNFGEFTLTSGHVLAPLSLVDDRNRRICFAWIAEGRSEAVQKAYGWSGIMSLPLMFSLFDDYTLRIEPVEELASLRREYRRLENVHIPSNASILLEDIEGDCLEMEVEFATGDAETFGISVRCSPDSAEQTIISYNHKENVLALDAQASSLHPAFVGHTTQQSPFDQATGEPLKLRIFVDRSVVEVFADSRLYLAKRIYPSRPDSLGISLFSRGGTTTVRAMDVWQMAPVWPTGKTSES